jgi:predicted nucleotidyltransferase
MHSDIEKHREALTALCHRYGVVRPEVFGSAARGADFDPASSDADFLVEFDKASDLSALDRFPRFLRSAGTASRTAGRSRRSFGRQEPLRARDDQPVKRVDLCSVIRAFLWDVPPATTGSSKALEHYPSLSRCPGRGTK